MPPRQSARSGRGNIRERESTEALANRDHEVQDTSGSAEPGNSQEIQPDGSTSQISSTSNPTEIAGSPTRRSVQRLKSALPRNLPNPTSKTNAADNSSTRLPNLKFKPKKSLVRRSETDREADDKAEAERRTARQTAEGASIYDRGGHYGRGRGRGQRGGLVEMNRWKNERFNISHEPSGHLGGSTVQDAATSKSRRGAGPRSGLSDPSEQASASGTRVKKEPTLKPEKDKDGDVVMRSSSSKSKRTKVKIEERGPTYIPSEDELDSEGGKRVNIDDISTINLISSEDEDEDDEPVLQSGLSKGKRRDATPRVPSSNLMPVRIQRQEHVERVAGVNTDASSLTSAELRRRAKNRAEAEGTLFLSEPEDADVFSTTKPKLRRKAKDVEFVRNERKWKGVYQDEDDSGEMVKIKDEPKDDRDIVMSDTLIGDVQLEPTPLENADVANTRTQPISKDRGGTLGSQASLEGPVEAPEADTPQPSQRLPKIKGYHGLRPVNFSEEEEEDDILAEVAAIVLSKSDVSADTSDVRPASSTKVSDDDSDVNMDYEDTYFQRGGREEVYLFQLPPVVPSLRDISKAVSKSDDKKKNKATPSQDPQSSASNDRLTAPIKDEIVIKADPDELAHLAAVPHSYTSDSFHSTGGQGGVLSIYEKGSMFATWGGMSFEITKEGTGAKLAQELMVTEYERAVTKVEDESRWEDRIDLGKEAWAMGQTRPGHVCVPESLS